MLLNRIIMFAAAMLFVSPLYAQGGAVGWGIKNGNTVFRWEGDPSHTTVVPGNLKQVSLGGDGEVWGVGPSGEAYRWDGSQWQQKPGTLAQISVGNAREVWGVTPASELVHWNGASWEQPIPARLRSISVGVDGTKVGINTDGAVLRRGASSWDPMDWDQFSDYDPDQPITQVSVTDSERISGLNQTGQMARWTASGWQPGWKNGLSDAVETQTGVIWWLYRDGHIEWAGTQPKYNYAGNTAPDQITQISVRDPVSAAPTPNPTPPGTPADLSPDMLVLFNEHNRHRADHCTEALTWSPQIAADAQEKANTCVRSHDSQELWQKGEGENLSWGTAETAQGTIDGWYGEIGNYNFNAPVLVLANSHFTQVLWKGSTELGCAANACSFGSFWVCRYKAQGNFNAQVEGVLKENVHRPKPCN